jgi:hypothetical protein
MDSFQVAADDTTVLQTSHIVEELQASAQDVEMFPVLIDGQIEYFHDIDGGYSENGYHVVNLIHRVQGHETPPSKTHDYRIELHLDDFFYTLDVADTCEMGEYPDEDFVLSLQVTDYKMGPYSFSDALSADIDKREQEFSHNNE